MDDEDELSNAEAKRALRKRRAAHRQLCLQAVKVACDYYAKTKQDAPPRKKRRGTGKRPGGTNSGGRPSYWDSTWGRMLKTKAAQLEDPNSEYAKKFRRRFRVPYPFFQVLVKLTKDDFEKNKQDSDAFGRASTPTELRVLGVLRVLGRGTVFDGIHELSNISEQLMNTFFHAWTEWFVTKIFPLYVHAPSTADEVAEIVAAYHKLGLPGAVGSMDAVHAAWACPVGYKNLCKGKEGFPTLAWNVVCDHKARVIAVMPSFFGATNDKTMVRYDDFVDAVRSDPFFTEFGYKVKVAAGPEEEVRGVWIIVDGGYHKWRATQCALPDPMYPAYAAWREQMESVRKDIEGVFGRIKNRFRILKTPLTFRKKSNIDNLFMTCVGLHNMLLEWDTKTGRLRHWEVDVDWDAEGKFGEDEEGETGTDNARLWGLPRIQIKPGVTDVFDVATDYSDCGWLSYKRGAQREMFPALYPNNPHLDADTSDFHELQSKLVQHYASAKFESGHERVGWLRSQLHAQDRR